jgi:hypothetical protein
MSGQSYLTRLPSSSDNYKHYTIRPVRSAGLSRRLPTAAPRVHAQVWSSGGGKLTLSQVFSEYFSFPCQSSFHQIVYPQIHSRGRYNRPEVADVPTEGVAWSAQRIPTAVNLYFLNPEPLLFHSSSSSGWVVPVPDPLLLRKSGSAGNGTQDLWLCSQELWPLDHKGIRLRIELHYTISRVYIMAFRVRTPCALVAGYQHFGRACTSVITI